MSPPPPTSCLAQFLEPHSDTIVAVDHRWSGVPTAPLRVRRVRVRLQQLVPELSLHANNGAVSAEQERKTEAKERITACLWPRLGHISDVRRPTRHKGVLFFPNLTCWRLKVVDVGRFCHQTTVMWNIEILQVSTFDTETLKREFYYFYFRFLALLKVHFSHQFVSYDR